MSDEGIGRARGGIARARRLTPDRRSEIARSGALTRGSSDERGNAALATYGAPDRPLRIGPVEIPCYVLQDGTRVLAQRGLQSGLGLSEGGGKTGARRIVELLESLGEKGLDTSDLVARANSPIRFVPPHGGNAADGFEATILPDLCAVLIDAGRLGKLGKRREHLAERASALQHGFATIGIIALVDEATGYQKDRAKDALARILEEFIAKELQPYVPTFQAEFYEEIFRLRGLDYPNGSVRRPQYFGNLTNDVVYKRLAPGVLEELKKLTPKQKPVGIRINYFNG
jgi:P63C domain-containing protein